MKLIVTKSNLKDALSVIEKAGGENLNLPILKNLLLETTERGIKITATNLEIGINFFISGKIIEKGRVTIPLSVFSSLVNNLSSERISLEKKGHGVYIKTDNYEATLHGLPAEEFPLIPKIKSLDEFLKIKADVFKESLDQILVATQFSDLRPELNSVLFDFSLDTLKLVATDSFRLAEKILTPHHFESNYTKNFKILVPLKTSQELMRILKKEETIKIYHDPHQILFETENFELISRLVEGNFPDYSAIVPKKFSAEAVVNREEFLNAVKTTSVFSGSTHEIKVKASENKKVIEVTSTTQILGENKYLLPAKLKGIVQEINFNWRYLTDGLKALKTEDLLLEISEENKPILIKSPNDTSYFYILMPILKA